MAVQRFTEAEMKIFMETLQEAAKVDLEVVAGSVIDAQNRMDKHISCKLDPLDLKKDDPTSFIIRADQIKTYKGLSDETAINWFKSLLAREPDAASWMAVNTLKRLARMIGKN